MVQDQHFHNLSKTSKVHILNDLSFLNINQIKQKLRRSVENLTSSTFLWL